MGEGLYRLRLHLRKSLRNDLSPVRIKTQRAFMKRLLCALAATFLLTGCGISKPEPPKYDAVDVYGANIINVSLGIQKDDHRVRDAVEYALHCIGLIRALHPINSKKRKLRLPLFVGAGVHNGLSVLESVHL